MLIWNTTDEAFSKRRKQEKLLPQLHDLQRKPVVSKKSKFVLDDVFEGLEYPRKYINCFELIPY